MKIFRITFLFLVGVAFLISCKKTGCTDPDALNFQVNASKDDHSCYYYWIGQKAHGGRVFYINTTRKHGLIAADFDLENTQWGCHGDSLEDPGINLVSVGRGDANSQIIANKCGNATAAGKCLLLDTFGFDDWYLPTFSEFEKLSSSQSVIGNFASNYYWASITYPSNSGYAGSGDPGAQKPKPHSVAFPPAQCAR